jgi:hypothetical protein
MRAVLLPLLLLGVTACTDLFGQPCEPGKPCGSPPDHGGSGTLLGPDAEGGDDAGADLADVDAGDEDAGDAGAIDDAGAEGGAA